MSLRLAEGSSVFLDLVRAVVSQLVVIGHAMAFFSVFKPLHYPNVPWIQNISVLIFFILSGFVICYTIVIKNSENNGYGFSQFFIDRFSRIFSAFIPALFFVLAIDTVSIIINSEAYRYNSAFNISTFFSNVFMLQDFPWGFPFYEKSIYLCCTSFGSARPFWTLAIEWWIYMFFGFLFLVFYKKTNLYNSVLIGFLSIVPLYNAIGGRGNGLTIYWLFGAVIYFLIRMEVFSNINRSAKLMIIIISIFSAVLRVKSVSMNAYDPIFAFFIALIFFISIDFFSKVKFSSVLIKTVRLSASYSFTLYLIHYSIIDFISSVFYKSDGFYPFFLSLIISNGIAFWMGRFTEVGLTKKIRNILCGDRKLKAIIN